MGRFQVIEYSSFFAVRDTHSGREHPMGDGVDTVFDGDGRASFLVRRSSSRHGPRG